MSTYLRLTFAIFALATVLVGAPLLIAPGRFLALWNWAPVDAILSRILGAALLALAGASLLGAQATDRRQTRSLVQIEALFCVLATLGILRHLLAGASYPLVVWVAAAILGLFAIAWIILAVRES